MLKFLIENGYDVKAPQREAGNAGIDFFIPNYNDVFVNAFNEKNSTNGSIIYQDDVTKKYYIRILPHCDANIPTGIHSFFDNDTGLIAVNKSGIASKKKLVVGACLIDPNYKGIIHANVINTSSDFQIIELGTKIVQFVPYKFDMEQITVESNTSSEQFYSEMEFTNRGDGAFGSTGV